jgi:hypothetical protein
MAAIRLMAPPHLTLIQCLLRCSGTCGRSSPANKFSANAFAHPERHGSFFQAESTLWKTMAQIN